MEKRELVEIQKGLKLYVETYGDPQDEACLFVNGAGANSSFWSESLSTKLVNEGFFVIKYDHRDFGYSSKVNFEIHPYDVEELADDALAVLDHLQVEKAHIIGHSMGGFIVQLLAIHSSDRVYTITSASASTNSPLVPPPSDQIWEVFMKNTPVNDFDKDIMGFLPVWKLLNGTAEFHENLAIEYTKNLYERQSVNGALGAGHVKAQASLTDRSEQLKTINIPALVIHGEQDVLVNKYGGIQTAECIKNSKLVLIPRMGHMIFDYDILGRFENEIIQFLLENRQV